MTREDWLLKATTLLAPRFLAKGAIIPELRVSVGFPKGKGQRNMAIGQYWPGSLATDNKPQIFISPVVEDGPRALDILIHELVHACTPGDGHGKAFKRLALAVGLEGKMTATTATRELVEHLNVLIADHLGPYPHAALDPSKLPGKQTGSRLLKAQCPHCGYTIRITKKWALEVGTPACPQHEDTFLELEAASTEGDA